MITGKELLAGDDYIINDNIKIFNPTIYDIVEYGIDKYFGMVAMICSNPIDYKKPLYDMGIDYKQISSFLFFLTFSKNIKKEQTEILLGDLNLSELTSACNNETKEYVLAKENKNGLELIIDQQNYIDITETIKKMHGIEGCDNNNAIRDSKMHTHILNTFMSNFTDYMDLHISTFTMLVRCGILAPKFEIVLDKDN